MSRREFVASLIILAGLTAVGTYFAVMVYPLWDDSWLELMRRDVGPQYAADFVLDRPLAGQIWKALAIEPESYFAKAILLHWLTCFGMALATLYFAVQLFPTRPLLSLSTACLAATTSLCRVQIVLATQPVPALSVLTSFLAVGLVASTITARLPTWSAALRWLVAIVVLVLGGLVTEYFVAASLAGIVWLLALGQCGEASGRMRSYRAAVVFFALTVVTYFAYHQLASSEARAEVRPESFLAQGLAWRVRVTLPVWFSSIYLACVGALLDRIASLRLLSFADMASFAAGILLAIGIHLPFLRRRARPDEPHAEVLQTYLLWGLVLAVAAGLLPLIVMGRRPDLTTFGSRFWTPVIPFALCASVGLLALLLRQKLLWILPVVCAVVAGWSAVSDGLQIAAERQQIMRWGPDLQEHLSAEGITVAIFQNNWGSEADQPRDYELTSRLAAAWPLQDRTRFWAYASLSEALEQESLIGVDPSHRLRSPKIDREIRGVKRLGPISRVLWIYVDAAGELRIDAVDAAKASQQLRPAA